MLVLYILTEFAVVLRYTQVFYPANFKDLIAFTLRHLIEICLIVKFHLSESI